MKKIIYLIIFSLIFNFLSLPLVNAQESTSFTRGSYKDSAPNNDEKPFDVANFNTTQELASINWQVVDNNDYDMEQMKQWEKIGKSILESKATDGGLWQEYQNNDGQLSAETLKTLGVNQSTMSKYDIRSLESFIFLTTPKQNGGAGREWLNVPTITKGYNVISGKEGQTQKDTTAKEADATSIEADNEVMKYISSHSSQFGQAIDFSEIDNVRATMVVKDGDGKITQMKKVPKKIPVQVGWQTDYRPENSQNNPFFSIKPRDLLGLAMSNMFSMNINTAFNNFVAMLAQNGDVYCELPENNPQVSADNLPQMVIKNLGLVCYLANAQLPLNFEPSYDLDQSGTKLGQITVSNLSGGSLPASGLVGSDYNQLELNTGKEWIGQQLGLPINTLLATNSHTLIEKVGERTLEEKFNINAESLKDLNGNTSLLIGRGYIEKQLNLAPGCFGKANFDDIKFCIGAEKANYIFSKPEMIDSILNLATDANKGSTGKLIAKSLSPDDYARAVGARKIDMFKNAFLEKYWDAGLSLAKGTLNLNVFGSDNNKKKDWIKANYNISTDMIDDDGVTSNPKPKIQANDYFEKYFNTKFANNETFLYGWLAKYAARKDENLVQKLFNGDKSVFYEAGLRTLSQIFSAGNQDMWQYYEEWLRKNVEDSNVTTLADVKNVTLEGRPDVPVIYPDITNNQFGLASGDLERIFILNRAEEVYRRNGRITLFNGLTQTASEQNSEAIFGSKPNDNLEYYTSDYYKNKLNELLNDKNFKDLLKNSQTKNEAQQISNLANEALNYKELSPDDVKYKRRITRYNQIFDEIQKLMVAIVKYAK